MSQTLFFFLVRMANRANQAKDGSTSLGSTPTRMIIKSPERPAAMIFGVSAKGARTNGDTIVEKALSPYTKIPKPQTTICDNAMERDSRRRGSYYERCA